MTDLRIVDRTRDALRQMGKVRGPVIVGPWLSEIGFELLYWIPWLRWALRHSGIRPDEVYVISRGGCRSWYQGVGAHYIDALDFYEPEEFRALNDQRIAAQATRAAHLGLKTGQRSPKQHEVSDFDRALVTLACDQMELPAATRMIHPSMMYAYFKPYWRRRMPELYDRSTVAARLSPPSEPPTLTGPYVAMKFYGSACLPPTETNRRLVQEIVHEQAKTADVVVLHSPTRYDDHAAFPVDAGPHVHSIPLPPARNLDIQTEVISQASLFVGTYGGFSYLAPFLGVPTLALYDVANFRKDHRNLMTKLAANALRADFQIEPIRQGRNELAKRGRRAA